MSRTAPLLLAAGLCSSVCACRNGERLIAAPSPSFAGDSSGTAAMREKVAAGRAGSALRQLFGEEGFVPDLFRVVAWVPSDGPGWIKVGPGRSQVRWGERFVYVTVLTDDRTSFREVVVNPPKCPADSGASKGMCGVDTIAIRRSTLSYERPALLSRALGLLTSAFGVGAPGDDRRSNALKDSTAAAPLLDVGPLPAGPDGAARRLYVAHYKFELAEESRARVSVRQHGPRRLGRSEGLTLDFANGSSVPFNVGLAVGSTYNARVATAVNPDSGFLRRTGTELRVGLYPFVVYYPIRALQPVLPWRNVGFGLIAGTSVRPSAVFDELLLGGTIRLGLSGVNLIGAMNFIPAVKAKRQDNGKFTEKNYRTLRLFTGVGFEF